MRERMITRTVKTSVCEVMSVQVSESKAFVQTLKVPGVYDDKELFKVIKKMYETDDYKPVSVMSVTVEETLYGMSEQKFMEYAEVLPPRKVYETEE